ncbi:hypothetical protein [Pseudomonas sp. NMI1173_11]|uniref:hypothetical protein n=1 Tax=Pseudomonas sp. NMI1173_11 TaxID=2903145 RepID=UPI001E5D25E9|nr:hypothetical protein [Pseudomonas sp. NMI1173_11]MCE1001859.1 hypothetical protein [Pseudomonas sp. NMI1173_11]
MSKHTPGPWRVGRHSSEVIADMPADPPFRGMTDDCVKHYGGYLVAESCAADDARLIAAAPELLEALENLENDCGQIPDHAWELIQSAIAKARGNS